MENKTNRFELTLILDPKLKEDEVKEVIRRIKESIKNNKGVMISIDEKGIKEFATPIKKRTSGFYFFIQFEISKDFIKKVEWDYRYDRAILRYLLVNLTKEKYYFQQLEINKAKEEFYKEEERRRNIQEATKVGGNVDFKLVMPSEKIIKKEKPKKPPINKVLDPKNEIKKEGIQKEEVLKKETSVKDAPNSNHNSIKNEKSDTKENLTNDSGTTIEKKETEDPETKK